MQRLYDFVHSHPKVAAWIFVISFASAIVGAAGHPQDIANWGDAFAFIGNDLGRWILVIVALAIMAVLALGRAKTSQPPKVRYRKPVKSQDPPTPPEYEYLVLREKVEAELVAVLDEGKALGPDALSSPEYGPYVQWRDKSADFVQTVFGATERQRFSEPYDPPPKTLPRNLEDHLKRLADLRDRPHTWQLQVNAEGLQKAAKQRRYRSPAEQIVNSSAHSSQQEQSEADSHPRDAIQTVLDQGAVIAEQVETMPKYRAVNEIKHWKREALRVLEEHAPDRIAFYQSDPPAPLSQEVWEKAQAMSSTTGYIPLKRDLERRLQRLDEIVRDL